MTPKPSATLQQEFKKTNIIGLAMMGSVFLYALIVLGISSGYLPVKAKPAMDAGLLINLKYVLIIVALLHYFVIRFFQKFSLKSVNYLPSGAIIIFALSEAVALYGLVLFLLSGNRNDFFIFMVLSLLYFYLFYPKYADWERLVKQKSSSPPNRA